MLQFDGLRKAVARKLKLSALGIAALCGAHGLGYPGFSPGGIKPSLAQAMASSLHPRKSRQLCIQGSAFLCYDVSLSF